MPRFCANLSLLYTEYDFIDRFAAAKRDGFAGVECHFPYEFDAQALGRILRAEGLELVLFNLPAGDWAAGERGIACHPGRIEEFRDGVRRALGFAQASGCARLNCLAGIRPEGLSEARARATLVDNLRYAAGELQRAGVRLLIEPINTRDMPGFFLNRSGEALDVIAAAGCANLYLQYDVYHAQIMEGDLARTIAANLPAIGHIQIADNPGRHEPGTGEINFPFLFAQLDRDGYGGWVGCEYRPSGPTASGLGWMQPWRAR